MDKNSRAEMYAFLSRIFTAPLTNSEIEKLKKNKKLLHEIGRDTLDWFEAFGMENIYEMMKKDYETLFDGIDKPVESLVLNGDTEIVVGLQNPVMAFYYQNGFEMDFTGSTIKIPDHLSVELGFMQMLVQNDSIELQKGFLRKHLGFWAPPYLLGIKNGAKTPFYRDVCDFCAEFIVSEVS